MKIRELALFVIYVVGFSDCALAQQPTGVVSAPMTLNIENGVRVSDVVERLTYDSTWFGDASATVKFRINGADFTEGVGVGEKIWVPHRPGTYTVTATAYQNGSIVGEVLAAEFEVIGRDLVNATISFPDGSPLYDGTPRTPRVTVEYQGETLVEGQDYIVSYENNVSGVGKAIITGMGRFHDEVEQTFSIMPAGICSLDISSGARIAHLPETITFDESWGGDTDVDYVRIMENGVRVAQENGRGEYTWNPSGTGLYTLQHRTYVDGYLQDTVYSATFLVGGGSLAQNGIEVTLSQASFEYDGMPKVPAVTVTHEGVRMTEGRDYSVVYRDNVEIGTGYAVISGMGSYSDVVEKAFSIVEGPGIYHVTAQQRYPWNGFVDVSFKLVGPQYFITLSAKDMLGNTNLPMRTVFKADGTAVDVEGEFLQPGVYHWVWNADADIAADGEFSNVTVSVRAEDGVLAGAKKVLEMTVNGYTGTETLTNVPVLVRLSTAISGFDYADFADTDGGGLIFTDESGSVVYPHEIDEWHVGGESLVWVKLPTMVQGTRFQMAYGGKLVVTQNMDVAKHTVWNDYAGVWHMNEDSGTAFDSTEHGLDAVPSKGTDSQANLSQMVAYENGVCGRARVNATKSVAKGNYMQVPSYDSLSLGGDFCISGFFKANMAAGSNATALFNRKDSWNTANGYEMFITANTATNTVIRGALDTAVNAYFPSVVSDWRCFALCYSGNRLKCYVDGVLSAEGTISPATDNAKPLIFGGSVVNGYRDCFNGQYDEIRLRGGSLSADRIKADYDMIKNRDFLIYAPVLNGRGVARGGATIGAKKVLEMAVEGYTGAKVLANVPTLVRLSTAISGFDYADFADANGGDLIFCDESESVIYAHEIDEWHTNGESLVWVKLPVMTNGACFKMAYGNPKLGTRNQKLAPHDVWRDYAGVWHMNEDSGTAFDSTEHGLDAMPSKGTNTLADISQMVAYEDGACGRARVNGNTNLKSGNYLHVPSYDGMHLGSMFTVSGFCRKDSATPGTCPRFVSRKRFYKDSNGWEITTGNDDDSSSNRGVNVLGASMGSVYFAEKEVLIGKWLHVTVVFNASSVTCYTNGIYATPIPGRYSSVEEIAPATDNGLPLAFGCSSGAEEWSLMGQYDEIRLRGGSLSADRIKADYDMIKNRNFLRYGPVVNGKGVAE